MGPSWWLLWPSTDTEGITNDVNHQKAVQYPQRISQIVWLKYNRRQYSVYRPQRMVKGSSSYFGENLERRTHIFSAARPYTSRLRSRRSGPVHHSHAGYQAPETSCSAPFRYLWDWVQESADTNLKIAVRKWFTWHEQGLVFKHNARLYAKYPNEHESTTPFISAACHHCSPHSGNEQNVSRSPLWLTTETPGESAVRPSKILYGV